MSTTTWTERRRWSTGNTWNMTGSEVCTCAITAWPVAGHWPGQRRQFTQSVSDRKCPSLRVPTIDLYSRHRCRHHRACRRQSETRVDRIRGCYCCCCCCCCYCSWNYAAACTTAASVSPCTARPRVGSLVARRWWQIWLTVTSYHSVRRLSPLPDRTWPSCGSWNTSDNTNRINVTRHVLSSLPLFRPSCSVIVISRYLIESQPHLSLTRVGKTFN